GDGEVLGCGGLFHDSDGHWIKGYFKNIGACNALNADMVWRERISHLIVESNFKILIDMVSYNCKFGGVILSLVVTSKFVTLGERTIRVRLVLWKESGRKENYAN
ncbi:receptor-like kinase, partial [Trifolium medium]|nr:receptor-like kinase [Trifolium medium]